MTNDNNAQGTFNAGKCFICLKHYLINIKTNNSFHKLFFCKNTLFSRLLSLSLSLSPLSFIYPCFFWIVYLLTIKLMFENFAFKICLTNNPKYVLLETKRKQILITQEPTVFENHQINVRKKLLFSR